MAKIHITLVGGQTTPIYQGIVASNPDLVILIHSKDTIDLANRIYTEIDAACELIKFDPVEISLIDDAVRILKARFMNDNEISVNITSGTKPWALLFYANFSVLDNATLIYIDQNNKIWDLKTQQSSTVDFDMNAQFRLLGNELKQYYSFDSYTEDDKKLIKSIRDARKHNFQDFNEMTEYLTKFAHQTRAIGKGGSTLVWDASKKSFEAKMNNKQNKLLSIIMKSDHARQLVLNTGWFEYEVALLLSAWCNTKELYVNCIFPTRNGSPKNEIDIIVNTGNKLLFVECKTQIKNETDIDKFASAVRVYGGVGSKALFVTDAPMSEKAMEKCADHGITTFSLQNNLWGEALDKMLFIKLESELFNINAK